MEFGVFNLFWAFGLGLLLGATIFSRVGWFYKNIGTRLDKLFKRTQ